MSTTILGVVALSRSACFQNHPNVGNTKYLPKEMYRHGDRSGFYQNPITYTATGTGLSSLLTNVLLSICLLYKDSIDTFGRSTFWPRRLF